MKVLVLTILLHLFLCRASAFSLPSTDEAETRMAVEQDDRGDVGRRSREEEGEETCERETFEASCPSPGQIILTTRALYGRMRLGRCVKTPYGSLGCGDNVLEALDTRCSGLASCSFPVSDIHGLLIEPSCPSELISYLEVAYTCVAVLKCAQDDGCDVHDVTHNIIQPSGYLSITSQPASSPTPFSTIPHSNSCHPSSCPWVFQPGPGQQYNFTFYIFARFTPEDSKPTSTEHNNLSKNHHHHPPSLPSPYPPPDSSPVKTCHKLAKVVDKSNLVSKDVIACGYREHRTRKDKDRNWVTSHNYVLASSRTSNILSAKSAIIEITAYPHWSPKNPLHSQEIQIEFLLEFNLTGCKTLEVPWNAWKRAEGDKVVMGCLDNDEMWSVRCEGNEWVGRMGACKESGVMKVADVPRAKEEDWNSLWTNTFLGLSTTSKGLLLVVGVGILFGFCLGFLMLSIAILFIRRKQEATARRMMGCKSTCEISMNGEGQEEMMVAPNGKYLFNNYPTASNTADNISNNNTPFNMSSWFACHKNQQQQQQLSQLELQPQSSSETYNPRFSDSIKQLYQPTTIPTHSDISHMIDSSRRHDLIYDIQTPSRTLPSQQQQQLYYHQHPPNNQLNGGANLPPNPSRPRAKPVLLYVTSEKQQQQQQQQQQNRSMEDISLDQNISIVSKFSDLQCECRGVNSKEAVCRCFEPKRCQSYLKSN